MATKNQRNAAQENNRLDKQDPPDLEALNSEPKGKTKSKQSRLRERERREELLQQQRLMQQENLKRRQEAKKLQHSQQQMNEEIPEVENVDAHPQHGELEGIPTHNQHPQQPLEREAPVGSHPEHGGHQQHGEKTKAEDQQPVAPPSVHDNGSSGRNEEDHGVRRDSNSRVSKSLHQRCTNCCGRPQFQSRNDIPERGNSRRLNPEEAEVFSTRREVDQYALEERINGICDERSAVESTKIDPSETEDSRLMSEPEVEDHCSCRCRHGRHSNPALFEDARETMEPEPSGQPESLFKEPQMNSEDYENETRLRGGCGGCGGARNSVACPCGSCGGAACTTNTGCHIRPPTGCCGGNQTCGLPCRCKCQSCSNPCPPCGTCGGQKCGKWNSCAGSGGGRGSFPRNTRRRNGPNCCGGGGGGGCGGCC